MAASAEIHSARAPLDRSLKEAVLFKVMLGKCKTMEDALEESGVSRHAAMTVHQARLLLLKSFFINRREVVDKDLLKHLGSI